MRDEEATGPSGGGTLKLRPSNEREPATRRPASRRMFYRRDYKGKSPELGRGCHVLGPDTRLL